MKTMSAAKAVAGCDNPLVKLRAEDRAKLWEKDLVCAATHRVNSIAYLMKLFVDRSLART